MTSEDDRRGRPGRGLAAELWVAARLTMVLLLAAGVLYPAALWLAGRAFPHQAEGSLLRDHAGRVVGSALIAQRFTRPEYFHPRPSAASYDGAASSGSNLGPTNPQLLRGNGSSYAGVIAAAAAYRAENGLRPDEPLPADAVTASGSGLDPDISPANAELQVGRVAAARASQLSTAAVRAIVAAHTSSRTLGMLGEPRVNVLALNLALDSAAAVERPR